MYKIFIVEDDKIIASEVKKHIEGWGCEVKCAADFSAVADEFASFSPSLVLLDISLPFYNGYHWCSEIRKISKVPIIFISSASDNMNIVMAMNMGADDFVAKPFDLNVLTAKVQAILRRTYDFSSPSNLLQHRGVVLNTADATLTFGEDKTELSKNEFKIMQVLLENKDKTVSRETIMERLWETDSFIDDNTLTVNVTRLRKRLERLGLKNYILTQKGLGYIIR